MGTHVTLNTQPFKIEAANKMASFPALIYRLYQNTVSKKGIQYR